MELTINLPESAFERLSHLADLTNQPLSELVLQSITGNLPPSIETAPEEIKSDLLRLQTLSIDELRDIAQSQLSSTEQERYALLLERNQDELLTESEQQELRGFSLESDQLMLKKAHACALLRWRGQPIRNVSQLSPNN